MLYQWKELEKTIPTIPNTQNHKKINLYGFRNEAKICTKIKDNIQVKNCLIKKDFKDK